MRSACLAWETIFIITKNKIFFKKINIKFNILKYIYSLMTQQDLLDK